MTRPSVQVSRGFQNSDVQYVKLRYAATYHITSAGNRIVLVGNQPSDPSNIGSATDPAANFSYWNQVYTRYMASASSIRVSVVADNSAPCQFTLWPSSDTTSVTDAVAVMQPYAKRRLIGYASGMGVVAQKHYISTRKMTGYPYLDVTDLANASAGGPPNQVWYWNVQLNPMDGVTSLDHYVQVDLTYYVRFWDRVTAFQ